MTVLARQYRIVALAPDRARPEVRERTWWGWAEWKGLGLYRVPINGVSERDARGMIAEAEALFAKEEAQARALRDAGYPRIIEVAAKEAGHD